jgi:hypothetical protein
MLRIRYGLRFKNGLMLIKNNRHSIQMTLVPESRYKRLPRLPALTIGELVNSRIDKLEIGCLFYLVNHPSAEYPVDVYFAPKVDITKVDLLYSAEEPTGFAEYVKKNIKRWRKLENRSGRRQNKPFVVQKVYHYQHGAEGVYLKEHF